MDFDKITLEVGEDEKGEPIWKTYPDYPGMARFYCDEVISGRVESCRYERLACERYVEMLALADSGEVDYTFSTEWSVDVCDFMEKMPLSSSDNEYDNPRLVLEPVQMWWCCAIFGFRRNDPESPREMGHRLVREFYAEIPRGNGKALALDTLIPTPSGWTTIGAISVGDEVFARDGSITKVVATSDVLSDRPCYRVNFSNEESVVADAEHQWVTTARIDAPDGGGKKRRMRRVKAPSLRCQRINGKKYWYAWINGRDIYFGAGDDEDGSIRERFELASEADLAARPIGQCSLERVRTTREIADTLTAGGRGDLNHSVRMPEPIDGVSESLLVDPYFLGAWLGDGSSRWAGITASVSDAPFIIEQIEAAGYGTWHRPTNTALLITAFNETRHGPGSLGTVLSTLGVIKNKHIPMSYLRASRADRLALLQGLMDTDGTCQREGTAQEFVSVNKRLAGDVSDLLSSLGIRHSVKTKYPSINGRVLDHLAYRIQFCVYRDKFPVFRMPRKLERMRSSKTHKARRKNSVQIVGCDLVKSVPVKCIQVEHPEHQFLFGRTMLPTHNSEFLAGIGLYCFCCEGVGGSKVFIAAPKEEQAKYVFDPMTVMIDKEPDLKAAFELEVTAKRIRKSGDAGAYIRIMSSMADREDGANPHVVIMEELHAQDEALFNVMDSSLGKRPNNLFASITTAGNRASGVCWNTRKRVIQMLEGLSEEISLFGVIYALDAEEAKDKKKAYDPANWPKINPMWGVTIFPSSISERLAKAKGTSPSAVLEFERTRLDIWSNAAGGLVSPDNWEKCYNPALKIEDFLTKEVWIGSDLASKLDICATGLMFPENGCLKIFCRYYVPAECASFKSDEFGPMYQGWVDAGHMIVTPGAITDQSIIQADLRQDVLDFDVKCLSFDQYQSNAILADLYNDGLPAIQGPTGMKGVSDPAKDFFAQIAGGTLEHDGNPVTEWMALNVVGYEDKRENMLPQKEDKNSPYKIDGIAALISANVIRLDAMLDLKLKPQSIYEKRGVIGAPVPEEAGPNERSEQPGD